MTELKLPQAWQDWHITEEIGEGAYGRVYRAEKDNGGVKAVSAIKVIRIPSERSEFLALRREFHSEEELRRNLKEIVDRYANEIRAMYRLQGMTNIVSIQDHYIEEMDDHFSWRILIRMEYLQSFNEYALTHTFTREEIIRLGISLCDALSICGQYGILHRDIKPENLFVTENGQYKLGDFGVAKALDKTVSAYSSKGTFSYMAPEVFHGVPYDNRVDIYCTGLIMYKLLNRNRDPFIDLRKQIVTFQDREDAQTRRLNGEKLPAPADADEDLGRIILKACEYEPSERYATAEEMKHDLEALLGIASSPAAGRNGPEKKKRRLLMIGTAALLAAAAAVIGFIFARGGREKGNTGTQAVPAPAETAGVSRTANQNYGGFQFTLPQGYILSEETADAVTWTRQDDSKAAIRFLAPRTVNASEGPEEDTAKNPEPTEAPAVTRGIFLLSDGEMGGRQITASFQPEDEPFVYAVQLGETQAAVQENRPSFEQMLLDVKPLGFSGLQRGAEAGDPVSMEMLAECYENGEGTAQNITQAVHWYTAAAEAGSTKAMLMLAQLYENGTLLLQDDEKAFEWYGRAAEAGSWKGMYNMMWCLYEGRGTEKDLAEAKRWLQKAAAASDTVSLSRVPAELLQDHETVEFTEYDFSNTSLGVELYMNHAGYTFD